METEMVNLLLQVPLAGVIVFLVIVFLKHIDANTDTWKGIIKDNQDNNNKLFEMLNEKVDKVVISTGETNDKVDETSDKVDKIDNRLSNIEERLKK